MSLIPSSGDEQGVMLVSVSTVFLGLAVIAVAMRLWSSHLKKRSLNSNDYLILLALVWTLEESKNFPPGNSRADILSRLGCYHRDRLVLLSDIRYESHVNIQSSATVKGGLGQHTISVITNPQKLVVFGKVITVQVFRDTVLTYCADFRCYPTNLGFSDHNSQTLDPRSLHRHLPTKHEISQVLLRGRGGLFFLLAL